MNEPVRPDQTEHGMLPANQSFEAHNFPGANFGLRLVHQENLIAFDGQAQIVLEDRTLQHFRIHFFRKKQEAIAAGFLGPVHGGIGVLDQGFGVGAKPTGQ